jgi:shikimate kinase
MQIFLTGMMGCGKSFWGKKIAETHQMPFFDLDTSIEQKANKTITEIFAQQGEPYFRALEHRYLKEVIENNPSFILATGGGTPCFYHNMTIMKTAGTVCYLKVDIPILVKRISHLNKRPLIVGIEINALNDQLLALYLDRKKIYEQSDHMIEMNQIDETTFAENFIKNYV